MAFGVPMAGGVNTGTVAPARRMTKGRPRTCGRAMAARGCEGCSQQFAESAVIVLCEIELLSRISRRLRAFVPLLRAPDGRPLPIPLLPD